MKRMFKGFNSIIKEISSTDRSLVALISTGTRDRVGEVLEPEGVELDNFRKNPVVLFAHNYRTPPIGRAIWIKRAVEGVIAKVQFATTQLAEDVFQLYKKGFMQAFSVGFVAKEWVDGDGDKEPRRTFKKWELIEFSAVPVPANPDALALALKSIKSEILRKELQIEKWGQDISEIIEENYNTIDEIELKPAPDVTEKYIRWRIKNPNLFKKMRTITMSAKEGIKAIVGRLKQDDGKTHVQAVLFDKKKWMVEKARKWIKDHRDSLKDATIEIACSDIDIETEEKAEYKCECIECGHKMTSKKHCKDLKCPECGGQMRRAERPGPGQARIEDIDTFQAEITLIKAQHEDNINGYKKEIAGLRYSLYLLSVKLEHQPDTVSEMTGDEIKKTIEDCISGVIRQVTGKVS